MPYLSVVTIPIAVNADSKSLKPVPPTTSKEWLRQLKKGIEMRLIRKDIKGLFGTPKAFKINISAEESKIYFSCLGQSCDECGFSRGGMKSCLSPAINNLKDKVSATNN